MFTLIIPALLRPHAEALPEFTLYALNKFLRYGERHAEEHTLAQLYTHYLGVDFALPAEQAYVSPVWQQIGMHSMTVFGGGALDISLEESESLSTGLNQFYRENAHFELLRADLWRLTLPEAIQWQAPPAFEIFGQIDGSVRAEGEGQQQWLQLQTEIQMWLHDHPMNRHREAHQQLPINGVWLWNASDASAVPSDNAPMVVGSNSAWVQQSQFHTVNAPQHFGEWLDYCDAQQIPLERSALFLEDLLPSSYTGDVHHYVAILRDWESRFFAPLWDALEQGKIPAVRIITDGEQGGILTVPRRTFWSFFKPNRYFDGKTL